MIKCLYFFELKKNTRGNQLQYRHRENSWKKVAHQIAQTIKNPKHTEKVRKSEGRVSKYK